MLITHFHFFARYAPFRSIKIKLCPFCGAKFTGPHEHQWGKLQGHLVMNEPV